jgi:hypothetical protein
VDGAAASEAGAPGQVQAATGAGVQGDEKQADAADAVVETAADVHPVHGVLDRIEASVKGLSEAVHREVAHLFEEAHSLVDEVSEIVD